VGTTKSIWKCGGIGKEKKKEEEKTKERYIILNIGWNGMINKVITDFYVINDLNASQN
jgi:hypothetical protein